MSKKTFWQKLKCLLGFHALIVDEKAQANLDKIMEDAFYKSKRFNELSDGTIIVFKKCQHCGAKR